MNLFGAHRAIFRSSADGALKGVGEWKDPEASLENIFSPTIFESLFCFPAKL